MKRLLSILMTCALLAGCLSVNVQAADLPGADVPVVCATGKFDMKVAAHSVTMADSSFPLEVGETVRINASYSPDGSMDFGLLDSDNVFHYLNVTKGSIDKTIKIEKRGNYTFAIRNNTDNQISVSGYVTY